MFQKLQMLLSLSKGLSQALELLHKLIAVENQLPFVRRLVWRAKEPVERQVGRLGNTFDRFDAGQDPAAFELRDGKIVDANGLR